MLLRQIPRMTEAGSMSMKHPLTLLIAFALSPLATLCAAGTPAEEAKRVLAEAEPRIRAIYERHEFRAAEFSAEWLPDSSGYRIQEREPKTNERVERSYEVRAGQPVKEAARKEIPKAPQSSVSPDGKWILEAKDRNLFLRDLSKDQTTQVTHSLHEREVSFRGLSWNPDSTHAVFVEADGTDVRRRAVLHSLPQSRPRSPRGTRLGSACANVGAALPAGESRERPVRHCRLFEMNSLTQ